MEAIDLYKEETAKMEEQGGGREKVLLVWFQEKKHFHTANEGELYSDVFTPC